MEKQIIINRERLSQVARAGIRMLDSRSPPFDRDGLFPDAVVPEGVKEGSLEHALFLFYGCSLDSMRQAEDVYSNVRKLSSRFDLTKLHKVSRKDLVEILGPKIETAIGNPLHTLMSNAKQLANYEGDPKNLKRRTVKQTRDEIAKFYQFGKQKAALLMKNLVRFGMWDFPEHSIYIKVDRHVLRICLGAGVVENYSSAVIKNPASSNSKNLQTTANRLINNRIFTKQEYEAGEIEVIRGEPLLDPISEAFRRYTMRNHVSAVKLDDALWGIGAKTCSLNDHRYCKTVCDIQCEKRPFSDNSATYHFTKLDKRNGSEGLLF